MSIRFPKDQKELVNSTKTDYQRHNQKSNPFLKNSFLGGLLTAFSLRVWDFYLQLKEFQKEFFLPTADKFLPTFGDWWGVIQFQAVKSNGNIVVTGFNNITVPINTQYQSTSGEKYITISAGTINLQGFQILSIDRSGNVAIAKVNIDHGFSSQLIVNISGAGETEYNGTHSITVTAPDEFEYDVSGSPSTPASGVITVQATFRNIPVESIDYGNKTNIDAGEQLNLTTPILAVDNVARTDYYGISGGLDAESNNDYRSRILERVQKPIAHFNSSDIIAKCREIPGVTRVFVKPTTPAAGQVTVYFVRDNDSNIIPGATEITETKNKLLEIKPATISDSDVIVSAPTASPANFAFTSITPDTSTMRAAIITSLSAAIKKQSEGSDFTEDSYRSAIVATVDRETTAPLITFSLSTTGDFTIPSGSIVTIGTVTF